MKKLLTLLSILTLTLGSMSVYAEGDEGVDCNSSRVSDADAKKEQVEGEEKGTEDTSVNEAK